MGCKNSKTREDTSIIPVIDGTADGSEIIIESEDRYDRQVISYIKQEISERPEMFLLNNLLMSMIFFRNYEKELYDFSNTAISREEQDLNAKLVTEVKKCILPDTLLDKIQENIKFHNHETENEEEISFKTIYVVNDNIEVKDRTDVTLYTSIDVPGCQVEIEGINSDPFNESILEEKNQSIKEEDQKGFLKLRVIEDPKKAKTSNNNSTVGNPKSDNSPNKNEKPIIQEDEYSTITDFKTPKNLQIIRNSERKDTLPDICFEQRKLRKLVSKDKKITENNSDMEDSEEKNDEAESESEIISDDEEEIPDENRDDLYIEVTYLSSKGFMKYFQNEIFPNTTGKYLGFNESSIESAQAMSGCILCNKGNTPFRIIPSVSIDWPVQATEYVYRKSRNTIFDKRDGIIYKWPTNEMVKEIGALNCVVIPRGFVAKRGENENSDIEWEIHFPKAERYLEMRMSHPQIRCYIFMLIIYKTFIEKFTTHHGLLIEHIRTHMFWECESDAKNWPEHKMGIKILQVIDDLNSGLSKSKIPHYFIKSKNIFENIPSKYLQFAQKVFHDAMQFPIAHFMKALKNVKYIQHDYYPMPDLDQLHRILTKQKFKVNRSRSRNEKLKKRRSIVRLGSRKHKPKLEVENLKWKKRNEKNNRKIFIDKQKKEEEEAAKSKKKDEENDLKNSFSKLEVITQVSVLQFFINHFIEIAKKSRNIGPKNQTLFYLKQAWYNLKVLEDIGGVCDDIKETDKLITKLRDSLEMDNFEDEEIAPPTPQRNKDPQNPFNFQTHTKGVLKKSFQTPRSEVARRLMREKRTKSVGFDDVIEKIVHE